jgi:molybdate transport system ATP-binding protein
MSVSLDLKLDRPGFTLEAAFSAGPGICALFGPSGAGKSSLVDMIAGLVRPSQGRIMLGGHVLFDSQAGINLPPERRRIGYVFQDPRLFPHLSVRGNLRFGLRRRPAAERYIKFDSVVALLGLEALLERRPATLSGGERQRVALGRALLASPELLLLDEPLAALDQARKAEILAYIERLRDAFKVPMIYVSHVIEEVARLADTLVLIEAGRVLASGPAGALMGRLDLAPRFGRDEAGSVIAAGVTERDAAHGLLTLRFEGGRLLVQDNGAALGAKVRVFVRAQDVTLALTRPSGLSVLNIIEGRLVGLAPSGPGSVLAELDIGVPLLARITKRSAEHLALKPGQAIFALIKAVAVDRAGFAQEQPG